MANNNDNKLTESDKMSMDKAKQKIIRDDILDNLLNQYGLSDLKKDGWVNVLTGLGGNMDKSTRTEYGSFTVLSDEELSQMYAGDGFGAKIVDSVADDMTREWIYLKNDQDGKVRKKLIELSAQFEINKALKWARLYGGSIAIIGALDGQRSFKPLRENNIKSVSWIHIVDRSDIQIERSIYNGDMRSPDFGKIELYYVRVRKKNMSQAQQMGGIPGKPLSNLNMGNTYSSTTYNYIYVHRSRILEFFGRPLPRRAADIKEDLRYWGSSELQVVWEQLRDLGGVMGHTANILYELVQTVYKFNNLSEMLAEGNEKMLLTRMQIINMYKSVIHSVFIGEDEEVSQLTANVSGIHEVIEKFMIMLSATAKMPVTRLFGRSPAGMNATGDGDERIYYDDVKSQQIIKLGSQLQKLVKMIAMSQEIAQPEIPEVEFNPLFQLTEKEEAEMENKEADTEYKKAQTAQVYFDLGVLDTEKLAKKIEHEYEEEENQEE